MTSPVIFGESFKAYLKKDGGSKVLPNFLQAMQIQITVLQITTQLPLHKLLTFLHWNAFYQRQTTFLKIHFLGVFRNNLLLLALL